MEIIYVSLPISIQHTPYQHPLTLANSSHKSNLFKFPIICNICSQVIKAARLGLLLPRMPFFFAHVYCATKKVVKYGSIHLLPLLSVFSSFPMHLFDFSSEIIYSFFVPFILDFETPKVTPKQKINYHLYKQIFFLIPDEVCSIVDLLLNHQFKQMNLRSSK